MLSLGLHETLDLARTSDQETLFSVATTRAPQVAPLLRENLRELPRFFPDKQWWTLHGGQIINVRTGKQGHRGFDLIELSEIVSAMTRLQNYNGFGELLNGFKNPSQIESTIFELRVADWCHSRSISKNILFAPSVEVRGHLKHPEFLWRTQLGSFFCECKQASVLASAAYARLSRMVLFLKGELDRYTDWDDELRLDVTFGRGTTNYLHRQFPLIVGQARLALEKSDPLAAELRVDEITARFRRRLKQPPLALDTMRVCLAMIGTVSTELTAATYLSLSMDLTSYRAEATARLVRDARNQLPADALGLIFLEGVGHVSAKQRLRSLLTSPVYGNTPWISLWTFGNVRAAVWRNGQPVDGSLLK